MGNQEYGLIDNWLRHIKDIYDKHKDLLEAIPEVKKRVDALTELNVLTGVDNVCNTTIIQNAWAKGQSVEVHGWCYSLEDGGVLLEALLEELIFNRYI
jgi:carbonic anhydrase